MGAQHRVPQPPIPEQRQHLGGSGVNPEFRDAFDPQQASSASGWTVWWQRIVGLHRIRSTGWSSKRTTSPSAGDAPRVTGAGARPGRPSCPCHPRRRAAPPTTCRTCPLGLRCGGPPCGIRAGSLGMLAGSSHHPQRVILRLVRRGRLFNSFWYDRAGVERVMGFCTPTSTRCSCVRPLAQSAGWPTPAPPGTSGGSPTGLRLFQLWLA
jgi:hypothetical protein